MSRIFLKFDKWLGTNKGARFNFIVLITICTLGLLYHLVGCDPANNTTPCNKYNQCPPPPDAISDTLIEDPISESSDQLVHAMINVESRGNDSAYCESEKAVGCLQIRPIMLREVNRLLRRSGNEERFSLTDRWSREKSIEIFDTWRSLSHPNDSDEIVARCWNGGPKGWKRKATDRYWEKVTAYLYENEES
jgi:hypothetical protein